VEIVKPNIEMKSVVASILFLFFLMSSLFSQSTVDKLVGYWMESGEGEQISLSSLLVFDKNEEGELMGSVFFMESDDNTREFALSKIEIQDENFSFIIDNTTISFLGKFDDKGLFFSGTFLLEGNTVIEAVHQKMDDIKIEELKNPPIPRKQIDHTDGVMIG
jgi:hypothetical protein